jgi:hypothetical protein
MWRWKMWFFMYEQFPYSAYGIHLKWGTLSIIWFPGVQLAVQDEKNIRPSLLVLCQGQNYATELKVFVWASGASQGECSTIQCKWEGNFLHKRRIICDTIGMLRSLYGLYGWFHTYYTIEQVFVCIFIICLWKL